MASRRRGTGARGTLGREENLFVLVPDLHQPIVAAAGGKERSIRTKCHVVNGYGRLAAPNVLPRGHILRLGVARLLRLLALANLELDAYLKKGL